MKKNLPSFFVFIFIFVFQVIFPSSLFAVDSTAGVIASGTWIEDKEVTFTGKLAARASEMLNWVLAHPEWTDSSSSIALFYKQIQNTVYLFLFLIILATAFLLIITRGKSIAARKFIPRFFFAAIFIALSFAIVQFLYTLTDIIQKIFLQLNNNPIQAQDLLNVAFDYGSFKGFRREGFEFDESAFISLLLIKATAITFYVMAAVLVIRKIILWFFIAISPILPLLLFYYPIRNTAKIWIGEFFRWLLYGPLFAIFLFSLVSLWKSSSIPLFFQTNEPEKNCTELEQAGKTCYPIAISILLGGPGQTVGFEEGANGYQNSVNTPDRFSLYVTALVMIWIVILLPFVLLQIFLDYFFSYAASESSIINKVLTQGSNLVNKIQNPPPSPAPSPISPRGIARALFAQKSSPSFSAGSTVSKPAVFPTQPPPASSGVAMPMPTVPVVKGTVTSTQTIMQTGKDVEKATNIAVPKITDIARFEIATLFSQATEKPEIIKTYTTLEKIAFPTAIINPIERERYTTLKETLIKSQQAGNPMAKAILSAANISSSSTQIFNKTNQLISSSSNILSKHVQENSRLKETLVTLSNPSLVKDERQRQVVSQLHQQIVRRANSGESLASSIASSMQSVNSSQSLHKVKRLEPSQIQNFISRFSTTSTTSDVPIQQRQQFADEVREESKNDKPLATSLLSVFENSSLAQNPQVLDKISQQIHAANEADPLAAKVASECHPDVAAREDAELSQLKEKLKASKDKGDSLAAALLSTMEDKSSAALPSQFPVVNRIQSVSFEDYEAVKKLWQDNYQKLDPPRINGKQVDRKEWIKQDLAAIADTVNLLLSSDPEKSKQGMTNVSIILPFLLIGGFSQSEVIAYLKAKQEAAKAVLSDIEKQEEEEDTQLNVEQKEEKEQNAMHMEEDQPVDLEEKENEKKDGEQNTEQ